VLRNRSWHPSQETIDLPGGEMRVSFHLDNLEEVEQWVMTMGVHATVVRPKQLMERIQTAAHGVLRRYAESGRSQDSLGQRELRLKRC